MVQKREASRALQVKEKSLVPYMVTFPTACMESNVGKQCLSPSGSPKAQGRPTCGPIGSMPQNVWRARGHLQPCWCSRGSSDPPFSLSSYQGAKSELGSSQQVKTSEVHILHKREVLVVHLLRLGSPPPIDLVQMCGQPGGHMSPIIGAQERS